MPELLFQLGKTKSSATKWRPVLAKLKRSHFTQKYNLESIEVVSAVAEIWKYLEMM